MTIIYKARVNDRTIDLFSSKPTISFLLDNYPDVKEKYESAMKVYSEEKDFKCVITEDKLHISFSKYKVINYHDWQEGYDTESVMSVYVEEINVVDL